MANIIAAAAVKYCSEQVRPAADLLAQAYYPAIAAVDRWTTLGSGQSALDQMQTDLRNCADRIMAAYRFVYCAEKAWFGLSGLLALFPNDSSPMFDNNGTAARTDAPALTGAGINNVITRCIEYQNWLLGPAGSFTSIPQVETATAVGTITGTGNATATVTGYNLTGSPIAVSAAVTSGDTAATWAGKVRTALAGNAAITALYAVGGASATITLTALTGQLNDPTLNIALANGTSTGITAAPTSANTTAGVLTRGGTSWMNTVLQCSSMGAIPIVLSDAQNLVTRLGELKTNYQASSNANLGTILQASVNPNR